MKTELVSMWNDTQQVKHSVTFDNGEVYTFTRIDSSNSNQQILNYAAEANEEEKDARDG